MYIVCFLHSEASTGEYLGFEGVSDIFEFKGSCLELIDSDFNEAIKECLTGSDWNKIKDSAFRIEFSVTNGKPYPTTIEKLEYIYPM